MKHFSNSKITLPLLAMAGTMAATAHAQTTDSQNQFNVLFIASDDMSSDLNAFDNPAVHTPNFDRLAKMGVVFNQAYNQAPLCAPSRNSLMTGYYPDKTEVFDLGAMFRDALPDAVSLAQMFKNNGYYTCRIGKIYHQGVPSGIGQPGPDDPASWTKTFNPIGKDKTDEHLLNMEAPTLGSFLALDCNDDELTDGISANVALMTIRQCIGRGGNAYGPARPSTPATPSQQGPNAPNQQAAGAPNQQIPPVMPSFEGGRNRQPFFIAVGFYRPHIPYVAPQKYFDMYPWENIKLPETREDDWDDIPIAAANTMPLNVNATEEQQKKATQAYYASVSYVDAQIGKLLDGLEEYGLMDNTIIVFWSDHGYNLGEHGQWQKQTLFEKSAKQPLLIYVPGLTNGTETDAIVQMVDIYPTLAEITGFDAPDDLQGHSLVPLLKDPEAEWNYPAYTIQARTLNPNALEGQSPYSFNPNVRSQNPTIFGRTIRVKQYRYTEWDEGRLGIELYDYENDPKEFVNQADNPEYKDIVTELSRILHSFYTEEQAWKAATMELNLEIPD